jgi:hypothetical protein
MRKKFAPCPAIAKYRLDEPEAGAPTWIAKYADGGTLLSPTFEGETRSEAAERARAFWEAEQVALDKARTARREAA